VAAPRRRPPRRLSLLLVGALPPPTGGVATHVREIVRGLSALGVEVTVVDPRRHRSLFFALATARVRGDLIHLHTNRHNRVSGPRASLCAAPRSLLPLPSAPAPAYIAAHSFTHAVPRLYREVIAVNDEIARVLDLHNVLPAWTPRSLAFRLAPPGLAQ